MKKKRFSIILVAVACCLVMAACKKEFSKLDGGTYTVNIPGSYESLYNEFPLQEWGTTLSMETHEAVVNENEHFLVMSVDWYSTVEKVKEQQGAEWDEDTFSLAISDGLFGMFVNSGKAAGGVKEIELAGRRAFEYSINALADPLTGEGVVEGEAKGTFVAIPTDRMLYVLVYYSTVDDYNEERRDTMFNSFEIND